MNYDTKSAQNFPKKNEHTEKCPKSYKNPGEGVRPCVENAQIKAFFLPLPSGKPSKKNASFFWTLSKSGLEPPPSFWTSMRYLLYRPILNNREVTFEQAQNSNIYQLFRQKVPQNFYGVEEGQVAQVFLCVNEIGKTQLDKTTIMFFFG